MEMEGSRACLLTSSCSDVKQGNYSSSRGTGTAAASAGAEGRQQQHQQGLRDGSSRGTAAAVGAAGTGTAACLLNYRISLQVLLPQ